MSKDNTFVKVDGDYVQKPRGNLHGWFCSIARFA